MSTRLLRAMTACAVAIAIFILGPIALGRTDSVRGSTTTSTEQPHTDDQPPHVAEPATSTAPSRPPEPPVATVTAQQTRYHLPAVVAPTSTSPECVGGYSATDLNTLIHDSPTGAGGIVGADYPRAQILPDGRVLWVFQDVFIGGDGSSLDNASFVHNAGLVQDGSCFQVLRTGTHHSWIGAANERPLYHWFWPLDSMVTTNGQLAQFMVEMRNANGTGASDGAHPVAVWIATIDLDDFGVIDLNPAADPDDRPLYGFSITTDDTYNYLYGNCYRQFADPGVIGAHDVECGPLVYVARIPLGHPEALPQYWTGSEWSAQRDSAAPIANRGALANPMQVRHVDEIYISVSKLDDWWGNTVEIDIATSPHGPFVAVTSIDVSPACEGCNTYFAHLLPWTAADGSLLIAISNNAWDMRADAFPHPQRYRPSIFAVALPDLGSCSACHTLWGV